MGVTIDPVRGEGAVAEAAALFRAYEASIDADLCFQGFADELAGLPGKYAPPSGELLIARGSDGSPLGCIALRPFGGGGQGEIKRLYVSPEARGLGVGKALVDAILAVARAAGYRALVLDTLPEMAAARALYGAAGFVEIPAYYDTPLADTLFLRRNL